MPRMKQEIRMSQKVSPGNWWLVTASGNRRKAVWTDDLVLLVHQEGIYRYGTYHGERWWQPAYIDSTWSFERRIEE